MMFKLIDPSSTERKIIIYLNDISFFASISNSGLERTDTGHPQKEVSYEKHGKFFRAIIAGIDGV